MAEERELYLFADFRVTAVPITCEIHCKEVTCLKMSFTFIISLYF